MEVVPRRHWVKANWMLETAGDVGFLRLDAARGLILLDSDQERYWVPIASVIGCEVEQVEPPNSFTAQTDTYPHFMAVLRANTRDGPWEAPLAVRYDAAGRFPKGHGASARQLQEWIGRLAPGEA